MVKFTLTALLGSVVGQNLMEEVFFSQMCSSLEKFRVVMTLNDLPELIAGGLEMEVSSALSIAVEANEKVRSGQNPEEVYEAVCQRNQERSAANCGPGGCSVLMGLDGIWNYGCWCNFGSDLTTGSGHPVNKFDEICRNYQLCLRCAKYDAKESGKYSCDPLTDTYKAISGADFNVQCSKANEDDPDNHCGTHLCMCNYNFFNELIQQIWAKTPYDSTPLHSNGWDQEGNCSAGNGPGNKDLECCGFYPTRFPYNADVKNCCDEKTIFNPNFSKCCDDGTVAPLGDC